MHLNVGKNMTRSDPQEKICQGSIAGALILFQNISLNDMNRARKC